MNCSGNTSKGGLHHLQVQMEGGGNCEMQLLFIFTLRSEGL
jgi:hypothetical protein